MVGADRLGEDGGDGIPPADAALEPALPRSVGLPGFMATPWKSTSPQSSRTRLTASLVPTEVPPEISTISHTASARSSVRRRRISSSPRAPKPAAVPPASSTSARLSYRKASSKAEGSSSSRSTRLTP